MKILAFYCCCVNVVILQLFDSTIRPLAFRPPYLGGNRLGLILMEIRREFMLRGVFPQQLPELQIGVEAVRFRNL